MDISSSFFEGSVKMVGGRSVRGADQGDSSRKTAGDKGRLYVSPEDMFRIGRAEDAGEAHVA